MGRNFVIFELILKFYQNINFLSLKKVFSKVPVFGTLPCQMVHLTILLLSSFLSERKEERKKKTERKKLKERKKEIDQHRWSGEGQGVTLLK